MEAKDSSPPPQDLVETSVWGRVPILPLLCGSPAVQVLSILHIRRGEEAAVVPVLG